MPGPVKNASELTEQTLNKTARPVHFGFSIEFATNGAIFSTYNIISDETVHQVAKTGVELEEILYKWAQNLGPHIRKALEKKLNTNIESNDTTER